MPSAGEGADVREPPCTSGGAWAGAVPKGNLAVFNKIKCIALRDPATVFLSICLNRPRASSQVPSVRC